MPLEVICPGCGRFVRVERPDGTDLDGPGTVGRTMEFVVPATVSGSFDELDPSRLPADTPAPETGPAPGSSTVLYGKDAPPILRDPPPADVEPKGRRPGLGTVVLASYASALTLACLGMLLGDRLPRPDDEDLGPIAADRGFRADRSREVEPPAPIPPGHLTGLGEPIRVGLLELTPLAVEAGPVVLEHTRVDGSRQSRRGGDGALQLRLRLRNTSDDAVFAPMDEAFLREPDRGLPLSVIETGSGDRIYPYPLAVESEWSIAGQAFPDLKPGESFETVLVSNPEARPLLQGPATWRLVVRTGLDRLDTIGIRFDYDQIGRGAETAVFP